MVFEEIVIRSAFDSAIILNSIHAWISRMACIWPGRSQAACIPCPVISVGQFLPTFDTRPIFILHGA